MFGLLAGGRGEAARRCAEAHPQGRFLVQPGAVAKAIIAAAAAKAKE